MAIKPDNFLALEPLIIQRLAERLDRKIRILSAADLGRVAENQQPVPSVAVLYSGYAVANPQTSGQRGAIGTVQTWMTVICTRNVTSISGAEARLLAGPVTSAVIDALQGWRPAEGFAPLALASGATAEFTNGLFYLPLSWTAAVRNYLSCNEDAQP